MARITPSKITTSKLTLAEPNSANTTSARVTSATITTSIKPKNVLESKPDVEPAQRRGEDNKTFFRSDRFYKIDGRYYFSTREGVEVGPYESKGDAEAGLERFIDSINKDGNASVAKRLALNGNWAVTMFQ